MTDVETPPRMPRESLLLVAPQLPTWAPALMGVVAVGAMAMGVVAVPVRVSVRCGVRHDQ